MARTPLMNALLRLHHDWRVAGATGIPMIEQRAAACERRVLSRRQVLGRGLAAAGVVGLGALPGMAWAGGSSAPVVAIVGAGIAGLHCAERLARSGVRATVYEAATRVGGRMLSDRSTFAAQGQHCELGGEFIDSGHRVMLRLAQRLGIALIDFASDDPALSGLVGHIGGRRLSDQEILDGYAPIAAAIDAALRTLDRRNQGVTFDAPNGGEALDQLSIAAWFDSIGAAGPVRKLLEVAYTIEFGLDPQRNNVLNLMFLISTALNRFAVFGDSDERFHAAGGNDLFTTRLAAEIPGQIEFGRRLTAVRTRADGRHVLTFAKGGEAVADRVVFALPFSILREVDLRRVELPAVKRRAIAEIGYGQNTKLMCGFSSRIWRAQGSDGQVFTDLAFQNTWDTSRLQPGNAGIATNYLGGATALAVAQGQPAQRAANFVAGYDRVFPGAQAAFNGRVVRQAWNQQPLVKASYSSYLPGQYTAFAGAEPIQEGALHFCGEHTTLDFQGYMEGGARTGKRAADEVLAAVGGPVAAG